MNTYETKIKELCDKVYERNYCQITIDLVQDEVEELLSVEEEVTADKVGACAYKVSILKEAMNPAFEIDMNLLEAIYTAIKEWETDVERTNTLLGLPPQG